MTISMLLVVKIVLLSALAVCTSATDDDYKKRIEELLERQRQLQEFANKPVPKLWDVGDETRKRAEDAMKFDRDFKLDDMPTPTTRRRYSWHTPSYFFVSAILVILLSIRCCYYCKSRTEPHTQHFVVVLDDTSNTDHVPQAEQPPPPYSQVASTRERNGSLPPPPRLGDGSAQQPLSFDGGHNLPPPAYDVAVAVPRPEEA